MSWVFLAGEEAYKLPVWFPYLDFSTLSLREAACRAELALNRRLASDVYKAVCRSCSRGAASRLMAFSFREFTNLLNKGERLPEIAKPEAPLDAVSFLQQSPVRGLRMKELSLLAREWRYSPATGSAGFATKGLDHVACPSCQPSPALRLAN